MSSRKVEIISRKTIKPSSPTPQCLKTFKLSHWDKRPPPFYSVVMFFYHADTTNNTNDRMLSRFNERSHKLQKALSDALTLYYPLAGRLKDAFTAIECKDEGAHFTEATIDFKLNDFLVQPDAEFLNQFIPNKIDPMFPSNLVLAIQLTLFTCGGLAISMCHSHKMGDASSLLSFLRCWTAMARECYDKIVAPKFLEAHSSPPNFLLDLPVVPPSPTKSATRRFVFHASKIASLKAKINGTLLHHQKYISTLDVVLAIIMKCAISASRLLSPFSGPTVLYHIANMRKRIVPPLADKTIGNIFWLVPVVFWECEVEVKELASNIRESLIDVYEGKTSKIKAKGEVLRTMEDSKIPYICTSLCRLPLFEVDFGWGKPSWVYCPCHEMNLTVLLPTKNGDDIEAWISLNEEEMAKFERQYELLTFASLNPSALPNRSRL